MKASLACLLLHGGHGDGDGGRPHRHRRRRHLRRRRFPHIHHRSRGGRVVGHRRAGGGAMGSTDMDILGPQTLGALALPMRTSLLLFERLSIARLQGCLMWESAEDWVRRSERTEQLEKRIPQKKTIPGRL